MSKRKAEREAVNRIFERIKGDFGLDPKCVTAHNAEGKPYILGSDLNLGISHSGNIAAAAVSVNPVGVDVQIVSEVRDRVVSRFFTDDEKMMLEKSENKNKTFTALWTVKEANFKLCGDYRQNSENIFSVNTDEYILTAVGESAANAEVFIL